MGKKLLIGLITLACLLLFASGVFAQEDANRCKDRAPASAPILTSVKTSDKSVTLTWIEAQEPVNAYLLVYSTSEYTEQFGDPNIGGKGTTTYTVNELTNGVKYYFKVRGIHGCKAGKFSNKLAAVPGVPETPEAAKTVYTGPNLSIYKQVLGASTSAATKAAEKKPTTVAADTKTQPPCSKTCLAYPIWIAEILLLVLYFSYIKRIPGFRPVFSIIIPVALAVLFFKTNGTCSSGSFSCKYFLPVNIMIFILMVVVYKQKYLNLKLKLKEHQ